MNSESELKQGDSNSLFVKMSELHPENLHPEISMKKEKIYSKTDFKKRKTKIVCTLGPSSYKVEDILNMLDAGMEIARLNFSHGDHQSHKRLLDNIRDALRKRPLLKCAIMLDTKGPEIRTGLLDGVKQIYLTKDQILEITTDYSFKGNSSKISCSYPYLTELPPGTLILISDGSISCEVIESNEESVFVKVLNDSTLGHCKNMNLPGQKVKLPTITDKDEDDIVNFGVQYGVDIIAASFVRSAEDVNRIRELLGSKGADIQIFSKIENQEGMDNFEKILAVTDGVMVARGDLGMEIPTEKVFIAQKYMIDMANILGKPVITATQMMESMIQNPRPTRAEATDVANAVLDGTDCVMLSGETANGLYPVKVIEVMGRICTEAEAMINYDKIFSLLFSSVNSVFYISQIESDCINAVKLAGENKCDLIVTFTKYGKIARLLSKYRPAQNILSFWNLITSRGVKTLILQPGLDIDNMILQAKMYIPFFSFGKKGDSVLFVIPEDEDNESLNLLMKIDNL